MSETSLTESQASLLRNRNFLLLWVGQALSLIGDYFFMATILIWIIDVLARDESWLPLATSGVALSSLLPALLLGPIAGVFVDRWDRKAILVWTDVVRFCLILLFLLLTLLVKNQTILLVCCFVVLFLVECGSQFFLPARVAVVADLVPQEQHSSAYGSLWQVLFIAQIIGISLAAPLYVALGPTWAIALNAATFLVSFLLLVMIHVPEEQGSEAKEQLGFWQDFKDGLKYLMGNRILVYLTITGMLFMFGAGGSNSLEYPYGVENLHVPLGWLGLYAACYGIGVVIGMPIMTRAAKLISEVGLYGMALIGNGISMLVLSRLTTPIPGMVCWIVCGIVSAGILLVRFPITVLVTPRELIGRVTAFQAPVVSIASLLGGSLAGILATGLTGLHAQIGGMTFGRMDTVLVGIGMLSIGGGVFAWLYLYPAVKAFRAKQTAE